MVRFVCEEKQLSGRRTTLCRATVGTNAGTAPQQMFLFEAGALNLLEGVAGTLVASVHPHRALPKVPSVALVLSINMRYLCIL